ncbi:unnamed protein product [Ilex paraguariensis]|uniref:RING-type domain-containing protein n=1 Tax=Ilex paraguariensis TaxID=185542 RepID=A0ABC8TJM9_9AQUA
MELFSCLRLSRLRNGDAEPETHDSAGERNLDTEVSSSERKRGTEVEEPSERNVIAENPTETATASLSSAEEGKLRSTESPPADDCCPICFCSFVFPCRAPCGHWYCGGCILQYWNHIAALKPCKCPMCSQQITTLTPEASLFHQPEVEVTEILSNVQRYNRLFVGGIYGHIVKVLELPLVTKRIVCEMMDPDRPGAHLKNLRLLAIFLGFLYAISPFDFIPTGYLTIIDVFDYSAMVLSFILYLAGLYLRRRRFQQVRELAAIQR